MSEPGTGIEADLAPAGVRRMIAALLILSLPSFASGPTAVWAEGAAAASLPGLFTPEALVLFLIAPLVALSAAVLVLLPGLLLALGRGGGGLAGWLTRGLAGSILVLGPSTQMLHAVGAGGVRTPFFQLWVLGLSLPLGVLAVRRAARAPLAHPCANPEDRLLGVSLVLGPWVLMIALARKLFGENFNGDGIHALEATRQLLSRPFPFWPEGAGTIGSYPGVTSALFTLPNSWFVRMFGPTEAGARLPYFLYIAVLAAAVAWAAQTAAGRRLQGGGVVLLWLGMALFTAAMAFSATYNAYSADLSLPGTQDTLLTLCFLGFVAAFMGDDPVWGALFILLSVLGLPSGFVLVGLFLGAAVVVARPFPLRRLLWAGAALVLALVVVAVAPGVLARFGAPPPGSEYSAARLLDRLRELRFDDLRRFGFLAVPAGIVPVLALAWWKGQAPLAKPLTLVIIAYFGLFFVQPKTTLHYYLPAAVFAWVVFLSHERLSPTHRSRRLWLGGGAGIGLVCLALSWPVRQGVDRSAWAVGSALTVAVGNYDASEVSVFEAADLLLEVLPPDWARGVPDERLGGSPLVWLHYAQRTRDRGGPRAIQLLDEDAPIPLGGVLIGSGMGTRLWVTDLERWEALRSLDPGVRAPVPIYHIPKGTHF